MSDQPVYYTGGAWKSWAPTLIDRRSGVTIPVATHRANFYRVGRFCQAVADLEVDAITGADVDVSPFITDLAVALPAHAALTREPIGTGFIYDTSTLCYYPTVLLLNEDRQSATLAPQTPTRSPLVTKADRLTVTLTYETATSDGLPAPTPTPGMAS